MTVNKLTFYVFLMFWGMISPAFAHSFNVAIILPSSSPQTNQFHQGFMLATTQRDSHPDEVSDGHLGGLDVYVSVTDAQTDIADDIDIVVVFTAATGYSPQKAILLPPGQSPFNQLEMPGVADFIGAFETAYGNKPTVDAAWGYNAARRIDAAVRVQGGVDDKARLLRNFKETTQGFTW